MFIDYNGHCYGYPNKREYSLKQTKKVDNYWNWFKTDFSSTYKEYTEDHMNYTYTTSTYYYHGKKTYTASLYGVSVDSYCADAKKHKKMYTKAQAAERAKATIDKFVAVAVAEYGKTNYRKYSSNSDAWCVDYVYWCANKAGLVIPGKKTSSTRALKTNYKNASRYIAWNAKVAIHKGDIIITKGHTAIVRDVDANNIYTIEGNWSNKVNKRTLKRSIQGNKYYTIEGFGLNSYY